MSLFSKIKGYFARGLSGYDSGNFKRQNSGWTPVSGTAESLNSMQRNIIRERARDLERNSDDINSLIEAFEKNVVGTGIKLQAKIRKTDDIDSEDDEELNTLIEHKFAQWCKAENCDIGEEFSFADIQRLCQRRRLVDGGIFVIFVKDDNGKSPFKLQLKEVSELDESVMYYKQNQVISGIEINKNQTPVAYHFLQYSADGVPTKSIRIEKEYALFLNCKTRPSEIREFPPLGKVLMRIRDINEYMTAVSVKERVLACLAVFRKKKSKSGGGFGVGLPGNQELDVPQSKKIKLSPGMIEDLEEGEEIQVVNPSGQASNAKEFITIMTRKIASSMGLSYEAVSRDMSQVNYSSARQSLLDDRKTYDIHRQYMIDKLFRPVYERWLYESVKRGDIVIKDFFNNPERYYQAQFIPNGYNWIDPLKEVKANATALETNQTTLEEICAGQGKDYRDVIKQRAKEQNLINQLSGGGGDDEKTAKKDNKNLQ